MKYIRLIAIGRKIYLFASSYKASNRIAILHSLMGTCKLLGINSFIWLTDVLQRIATHPFNKIDKLSLHN